MFAHYKFKSSLQYDTATFDGFHISVKDLKKAIMQQKKIDESSNIDLRVTNAETKEVYDDESTLLPRNGSFIIARVPVTPKKKGQWASYRQKTLPARVDNRGLLAKTVDLCSSDANEDDKIKAMISQSTHDYDPNNYMDVRGSNQVGPVPPNYTCYNCHQRGHWIKNCPLGKGPGRVKIRKCSGIPTSSMIAVEGPQVPGALMTPDGQFAVPLVHYVAYNQKRDLAPVPEPKPDVPDELICKICSERMTDAATIPCCGSSFCDDCIRGVLLESEDHECPDCNKKGVSPDTIVPNLVLRHSVANFANALGDFRKLVKGESVTGEITNPAKVPAREVMLKAEKDIKQESVISDAASPQLDSFTIKSDINDSTLLKASSISPLERRSPSTDFATNQNNDEEIVNAVVPSGVDKPSDQMETDDQNGQPVISPRSLQELCRNSPTPIKDECLKDVQLPCDDESNSVSSSDSVKRKRQRSCQGPHKDDSSPPSKIPRYHRSPSVGRRSPTPTLDEPIEDGYTPMLGCPSASGLSRNHFSQEGVSGVVSGLLNVIPWPIVESSGPLMDYPSQNCYVNYPSGSEGDYYQEVDDMSPSDFIGDPLTAFEMYLREKDEQKRQAARRRYREKKHGSGRSSQRSRSPKSYSSRSDRRPSPHRSLRQSSPPSTSSRRETCSNRSTARSRHRDRRHDHYDDIHGDRHASRGNNQRQRDHKFY